MDLSSRFSKPSSSVIVALITFVFLWLMKPAFITNKPPGPFDIPRISYVHLVLYSLAAGAFHLVLS